MHWDRIDIFHPSFYPCILDKLPDGRASQKTSPYKAFRAKRYLVKLTNNKGEKIQPGEGHFNDATAKVLDAKFWADFTNLYASPELGQQWVETLGATTAQRYNRTGEDWNITFSYRMDLSRDLSGYGIGPHTDTDFKWVTTLYYLPSTPKHAGVGTAILMSRSGKLQKAGTKHMNWGPEWKINFRAPFIPNSVLAFAPCWHSWHGVPKVKEKVQRDTLQGFIVSSKRTEKFPCGTG